MKSLLLVIVFTSSLSSLFSQVTPLVNTTWNQGCYYNESCPSDAAGQCGQVYTGCYATAMAQIMKYHSWPNTGTGSSSYNAGSYGTLSVDYSSASYDWASMPNNVTSSNSEVAKIMHHAGVANEMIYSTSSSDSFFGFTPIKKHFKYSPKANSIGVLFMSAQEWEDAIKESLDNGMPVFAKSTSVSHFYIIDGYSTSPSLEFHFNFGWGGTYDGYYDLTNVITPAGDLTPRNAITNIKPLQGIEVTSIYGDSLNIGYIGGSISYELAAMNNWSVFYVDSWLSPDSLSGIEGWFNSSNGAKATVSSNPLGTDRLGKIIYTDGSNYDTLYVTQSANPTAEINEEIYSNTKIYPNPFSSNISITSAELINSAKIIDVKGKIIYNYTKSFYSKNIDLNELNKGIYFLQLEYDGSIIKRHKLVKN
jgi:hypothetical protein